MNDIYDDNFKHSYDHLDNDMLVNPVTNGYHFDIERKFTSNFKQIW